MKRIFAAALFAAALGYGAAAQAAGDPEAGATKARVCAGCHGLDGIGTGPTYPNLRGQHEAYLIKQLRTFRDSDRLDPVMSTQAKNLSDRDIQDLAAYYASLGKQ